MNDLILCVTLSQLANTQIGIVKVVSNTKYSEIPSTPTCMCRKCSWLYSAVNWYVLLLESNDDHITIETMKVITVVIRATRLTREICAGVDSLIGANIIAPTRGISNSAVSIIN